VFGYLRIVTHPAILEASLSTDEATANIEALLAPSHMLAAGEGDGFWASARWRRTSSHEGTSSRTPISWR